MTAFVWAVQWDEKESIGNWGRGGTEQTFNSFSRAFTEHKEKCTKGLGQGRNTERDSPFAHVRSLSGILWQLSEGHGWGNIRNKKSI